MTARPDIPDVTAVTARTNRRLLWAVGAFLAAVTALVAVGVAAGLSLVADARDAAETGRALVARQRADDAAQAKRDVEAAAARAATVAAAIDQINAALAEGLRSHDANAHADHEELLDRLAQLTRRGPGPGPTLAARPAIPPPAPSPTAAPPAPAAPSSSAPATTTTTCPERGRSGRCR